MMRRARILIGALGLAMALAPLAPAHAQAPADSGSLEVIIAIDASGSMAPAIDAAKAAANDFVASMPRNVPIGLETFADDVTVSTLPTTDRALITDEIGAIATGGDTALYDVVVSASQHFTPTVEHRVLVILSDGKDEGSAATLVQAMSAVQGISVEAISLTTKNTDNASLSALGTVTSADDLAGVAAAFGRVTSLLTLGIDPMAPASTTVSTAAPATTAPTVAAAPATTAVAAARPATPAAASVEADTAASSNRLWVGGAALFVGLFGLGLLLVPRARVSKARMGITQPRRASDMGKRTMSAVDEALERHGKRADLSQALALSEIDTPPAQFVGTVGLVAVVAGLVGLLIQGPLLGLAFAAVVCLGVRARVRRAIRRRRTAFAEQLPDVLQLVTTALRSGFGLTQALESVAEEAEEPARSEFAQVLVESRLGRDLPGAMRSLAERMTSPDLEWVVGAIEINRDTGGNLSEILATVGATIRERRRMERHVDTLTSEGRLSVKILTVMPLVMALWQWWMNPSNFDLLTHGGGLVALIAAVFFMIFGTIWARKIVTSISL